MRPGRSRVRDEAVAAGFRSGFELTLAKQLAASAPLVVAQYEEVKLLYSIEHGYTPDWRIRTANGRSFFIEAKGLFSAADRTKMLCVRDQNVGVDIRLVFQNASTLIRKGSKTTYGQWATNAGFKWADKAIPEAWLHE